MPVRCAVPRFGYFMRRCFTMTASDWFLVARWIGYLVAFVVITLRVIRTPRPP
jgi:hypothetical protein